MGYSSTTRLDVKLEVRHWYTIIIRSSILIHVYIIGNRHIRIPLYTNS